MNGTFPELIFFLFPLAFSPGPGNLFFAAIGARFGFAASLPALAGYHVATWIVTVALGFGAAALLDSAPIAFELMRWIGGAYILYLAWKLSRSGLLGCRGEARPASSVDGVMLLILNPKAYVILSLMLSQFLRPDANVHDVLSIATAFTFNNLIAFAVWTVFGDRIGRLFSHVGAANLLNTVLALMLVLVALWLWLGSSA